MKRVRTLVFWAHLVTGASAALVVLVMSVTGVLLTYQRQITAWVDTRGLDGAPVSADAERLPADALLSRVVAAVPGEPTSILWRSRPDAPAEIAYGRGRVLFVHAYTGEVLGEGSTRVRAFFRVVTNWHRWLAREGEQRALGRSITGASNLAFLFLVVSGFYLWWPRNWTLAALRNVVLFRRGLTPKARDFNWHNVIGFWSALPLFVVVLSGVVISYPWASALVYRVVGERPPAPAAAAVSAPGSAAAFPSLPPAGLDPKGLLRARAERHAPGWRSIALQLGAEEGATRVFTIDHGDGGQPQKRAQLTLDRASGEVVRWEPFAANTRGRRLRSILRFAHTGEVAGLLGQTVAGLVSLGAAVLVWTGLALSLRRLRAWARRQAMAGISPATGPSSRQRGTMHSG